MREFRCIVFSDQELLAAVVDFRRRHRREVPVGTVQALNSSITGQCVATTIDVLDDHDHASSLHIGSEEIAASLISYCLGRRIPLPRSSRKRIEIIDRQLSLVMNMSFESLTRNPVAVGI